MIVVASIALNGCGGSTTAPSTAPGPPTAVLNVTGPHGFVVQGLDLTFDASSSSGDGLTYLMEFGDGVSATDRVATHALEKAGDVVARLTVVDRFGREAVATQRLAVTTLTTGGDHHAWWDNTTVNPNTGHWEQRRIFADGYDSRTRTLGGIYVSTDTAAVYPLPPRVTGTLSGSEDIRLTVEGTGVEFVGKVVNEGRCGVRLLLTERGGSADGRSLEFQCAEY